MNNIVIRNNEMVNDVIVNLNKLLDTKLPIVEAYKLLKIINSISTVYDNFQKLKQLTIEKHLLKDETGEKVSIYDEETSDFKGYKIADMELFNISMREIYELEEELPFEKLDIELFRGLIDMTPLELNTIHFLFR